MITAALYLAQIEVPDQVKKNISLGMFVIIAISGVYCIIKCIQGADMLDRGENGKKKIFSGIAMGMAPWLAIGALKTTKLWEGLGISETPTGQDLLPDQLKDSIQLACWAIIGISAIWCIAKCMQGAEMLEKGEMGKKKIFSGIAIAAAPWVALGALNLSGYWDDLGLKLVGN